jgi:hypothetical protein
MTKRTTGWIGVDLDGTLAHYTGFVNSTHIGEPIKPMVERIQKWIEDGYTVKIFTARVTQGLFNRDGSPYDVEEVRRVIQDYTEQHIGHRLEVTNVKDFSMIELWDDRAVRVTENTGMPCCSYERGR